MVINKVGKTGLKPSVLPSDSNVIYMGNFEKNVKVNDFQSRGSTGRTKPMNLKEKLTMEEVQTGGIIGTKEIVSKSKMKDP